VKTIPANYATRLSEAVNEIRGSDPRMSIFDALRLGEKLILERQLVPDPTRRGLHAMAERYMVEHRGASYVDALREVSARHAEIFELATPTASREDPGRGRQLDVILEGLEQRAAAEGISGQQLLSRMAEERAAVRREQLLAEHARRGDRATTKPSGSIAPPPPARGASLDLAEGYGANADPQSKPMHAELHARAMSYASEHNVDYITALKAVAAGTQEV
jgi:hypothetical protein